MIQMKDIGALITALRAAGNAALTAGGTGDNTAVPGVIIDRAAIGMSQSGVLAIPFTATLAAGETLSVTYTVQEGEADDLSDAATLVSETVVAATGPAGGGTVTGCITGSERSSRVIVFIVGTGACGGRCFCGCCCRRVGFAGGSPDRFLSVFARMYVVVGSSICVGHRCMFV